MSAELDREPFEAGQIRNGDSTANARQDGDRHILTTVGPDGQMQDFTPAGVIAKYPLWQYLIEFPGGRLQATELAWDPAGKEWFNVYGDENRRHWEWGHWSQRGMNWNSMCATCHTTGYEKNYDSKTDTYRSSWAELGVGCESCHGPMRNHVDWQTAHRDQPGDPTIRPLDADQYFQVCGSCHGRRADLTGRFRPGEQLLDHYDPMLPDHSDVFYPDGQVREEDFEWAAFNLSYMHGQSVRCTNCHSSHSGKLHFQGNEMCLQCHQEEVTTKIAIDPAAHSHHAPGKPGSLCTDCHMPITHYMQRHPRHDHGMTIPDPVLTKEFGIPNACNRCHTDQSVDWAIEYVEKWYGERMNRPTRERARLLARAKQGDAGAVPGILARFAEEQNPNWRAVYTKFLAGLEPQADAATAEKIHERLTALLDDESPLVQAAAIEGLSHRAAADPGPIAAKLSSPRRLVRVKAAWALRDRLEPSLAAFQELDDYLRYNEDQPLGAFQRANWLMDLGRPSDALAWYEKAMRWDPGSAPFHYQYAVVLDTLNRSAEAIAPMVKAMELEPENALYPYSLGLLYNALGQLEPARASLRAAVGRDPGHARYWYNLALAEWKLGDPSAALDAITKAEQLEPASADYPYTRALILRDGGQPEQVRAALERTLQLEPRHQGAQALLAEL
jgi:tetratricopeptide (TPR) repeat protein